MTNLLQEFFGYPLLSLLLWLWGERVDASQSSLLSKILERKGK
ncbi:MAG TPA: hypothetical protein VNS50_01700 [Ginsengibacter sp.]|nr:hypothetical protein [Ginsengibacter sp.]